MQSNQKLTELISTLSPGQQAVVEEFVKGLKKSPQPQITFRQALDEFKHKHPELLRLLAK